MLQRFSIASRGGLEIFDYQPNGGTKRIFHEPQLISGFLEAIQRFSEEMHAPIHQIHFFNMMLYIKTYGEFSLRLILSTKIPENELDEILGHLAKETIFVLESHKIGDIIIDDNFKDRIKMILAPLTEDRLMEGSLKPLIASKTVTRIGLVGLAKAGKTSIKKGFFNKWSPERIRDIMPTVNVEISKNFQDFLNESFTIYDFGGQKAYRSSYLKEENLWKNLSALIFVIDIQSTEKFDPAREYLDSVWEIVSKVNKRNPRLSIFFHKYDLAFRDKLNINLQKCFSIFKDYTDKATFYLTTIEDESSHLALVKSLYFSLPTLMLKHQLESLLVDTFESTILPKIPPDIDESLDEIELKELENELYEKGRFLGINSSNELQEMWLKAVTGDWTPQKRLTTSRNIKLEIKGQSFLLTIRNWSNQGYSKIVTDAVIGGLLEGLLLSFHFGKPKIIPKEDFTLSFQEGKPIIVKKEGDKTTWELIIDEKFRI